MGSNESVVGEAREEEGHETRRAGLVVGPGSGKGGGRTWERDFGGDGKKEGALVGQSLSSFGADLPLGAVARCRFVRSLDLHLLAFAFAAPFLSFLYSLPLRPMDGLPPPHSNLPALSDVDHHQRPIVPPEPLALDQIMSSAPRRDHVYPQHSNRSYIPSLIPPHMDPAKVDNKMFYNYVPNAVKTRKRTTAQQLQTLEDMFKHDKKPNSATRKNLSNQLGMTPREVQVRVLLCSSVAVADAQFCPSRSGFRTGPSRRPSFFHFFSFRFD